MPAIIFAAISSLQMIQFSKNKIAVIKIIVQAFHHQFPLFREIMKQAKLNHFVNVLHTPAAQAIIV